MKTDYLFSAEYPAARFVNLHARKLTLGDVFCFLVVAGASLFVLSCVVAGFTA